MGRNSTFRSAFLFAIAGALASTSFAHAVDPNPLVRPTVEQQITSQVSSLREQIAQMQDQIAQINEDLATLREERSVAQQGPAITKK